MLPILLYVSTVLFLVYIILDVTWRLWKRKYTFLPSAPNVPWLGSAPYIGFSTRGYYKAVTAFDMDYHHSYVMWLGPIPVIFTGCPDYIEAVLKSREHIKKSLMYDNLIEWLSYGLVTSTGKKWKSRRASLTAAFHFVSLINYAPIFEKTAKKLVTKLKDFSDNGKCIDVQPLLGLATLDAICETAMGTEINALDSVDSEYVQNLTIAKELIIKRMVNPFLTSKFIYKLTSDGKEFYKVLKSIHNFTIDVINKKISERKEDINSSGDSSHQLYAKKKVFIDILLDLYDKGEIDVEGIQEEVDTFVFAGHDTTSTALTWILYEIGCRADIQQKIHEEIDAIPLDGESLIDNVRRLKYLECVIKECARFHPPVPMYSRNIETDMVIGDASIPRGTQFMITTFSLHMNEKYWDEPSVFKPERFESEEFSKRHPYCYLPFSAGPRNCIGQKFALLEIKINLHYILSAYKVRSTQSPDELEKCYDVITSSANGVNIEFTSRQK